MLSPRVLAGEENLRLAAELIVPGTTEIAHRNVRLHNTFLRYEIELSVDDSDGVAPRLGVVRESLAPLRMESLPEPMRAVCADYVIEGDWNDISDIFATYPLRRCEKGVPTIYVRDTAFDEERGPYDFMDSVEVDGMEATALSMANLFVPPEVRDASSVCTANERDSVASARVAESLLAQTLRSLSLKKVGTEPVYSSCGSSSSTGSIGT